MTTGPATHIQPGSLAIERRVIHWLADWCWPVAESLSALCYYYIYTFGIWKRAPLGGRSVVGHIQHFGAHVLLLLLLLRQSFIDSVRVRPMVADGLVSGRGGRESRVLLSPQHECKSDRNLSAI